MPLKILVVEDESLIALLMEDFVTHLGHQVAGTAMRLAEALELAQRAEIDFAILDVNLAGAMSFPVADVLERRGVPHIFATGYGSAGIKPPYSQRIVLHKPVRLADLDRAITAARAA
jgi:DNA-binding response OmpR family regulator